MATPTRRSGAPGWSPPLRPRKACDDHPRDSRDDSPETVPSAPETDELAAAQRPKLTNRLRLLPLAALCLCVAGTATVGAVHGGELVGGAGPAAAERAAAAQARRADRERGRPSAPRAGQERLHAQVRPRPQGPSRGAARPPRPARRPSGRRIKKENPDYVRGKDGWVFFTDYQVDNFSQALGRVTQTAKEEKAWARLFRKQAEGRREGGRPRTTSWSPPPTGTSTPRSSRPGPRSCVARTSLEKLMADHPELPWIDPRARAAQGGKEARHLRAAQQPLDALRRLRRLAGDHQVPARLRPGPQRRGRAPDQRRRYRGQLQRVRRRTA